MSSRERHITTTKKILSAGKGQLPDFHRPNTKAIFHYEVLMPPAKAGSKTEEEAEQAFPEDRSLYKCIDSTKKCWPDGYGKPLELVFGKQFQLPLFERCVRTMLVDEIAQFDVFDPRELLTFPMVSKKLRDISRAELDPAFAREQEHAPKHQCAANVTELGYPVLDELVRNGPRRLRIVFHLLEVLQPEQYKVDTWQMNEEQRLANVEVVRERGNQLFAQVPILRIEPKDFEGASDKYREGLTLLDQLMLREKPGEPEWLELDQKNVPLFLNLAQCYLKLGKFYEAANCATEALKSDPDNEKALFRRAKARMQVWDLDEALADLRRLAKSGKCTAPAVVEATMQQVEERKRQKQREADAALKAMFRGIGGEGK